MELTSSHSVLPRPLCSGRVREVTRAPISASPTRQCLLQRARAFPTRRLQNVQTVGAASTDTSLLDVSTLPLPQGSWRANIPLVGETFDMLDNHLEWVHSHMKEYGKVFRTNVLGQDCFVVGDWPTIERLMTRGEFRLVESMLPASVSILLGDLQRERNTNKELHTTMRRQQAGAFTPEAMATYVPKVEAITRQYLDDWAKQGQIHLASQMHYMTLDHADALVVGLDLEPETKMRMRDLWLEFMGGMYGLPVVLPGTKMWRGLQAKKELVQLLSERMASFLKEQAKPDAQRSSMGAYYVAERFKDDDPVSAQEMVSLTLGLFLAGHETSQAGHSVIMTLLPLLPSRIVEKLREEQREVVSKHGSTLTYAAMKDMKYAEAVSKEALRLLGPADSLYRKALVDMEVHGCRIPAGSTVMLSGLYAKATDPRIASPAAQDNPPRAPHMDLAQLETSFQPERWLSEATQPTGLFTFGMGPHTCMGIPIYMLESKALLALLLRSFDVEYAGAKPMEWNCSWAGQKSSGRMDDVQIRLRPTPNLVI